MAGECPDYVTFVRAQRCRMAMQDPCFGAVQAHHAGPRGLGQRAHDDTCIPLCLKHHAAWHDLQPPFRDMPRSARSAWVERQIAWTRAAWERHGDLG